MIRAGVIGSPAKHSLSPIIHLAWLKEAGIEGDYRAYDIAPDEFRSVLNELVEDGITGLNVTVPFKVEALRIANERSARADLAGAANVLTLADKTPPLFADNTDGEGLLYALRNTTDFEASRGPAVVYGAGGAARGAAAALLNAGAPEVRIVNRTVPSANGLALRMRERGFGRQMRVFGRFPDQEREALTGANVLINATTLGMEDRPPLKVDFSSLPKSAAVLDMVYTPPGESGVLTSFLLEASRAGHQTADGLDMLIGQARPSFNVFFGQDPPANIDVRTLCLDELERRRR